jgi:HEAT repeat protein
MNGDQKKANVDGEIKQFLQDLNSPNPKFRENAVRRLGERRAHPDEVCKMLTDPNVFVRSMAAKALGFYGRENLSSGIISSLKAAIDDKADRVCSTAIITLGKLKEKESLDNIIPFLNDQNPYIVNAAIGTIARLGPPEVGEKIVPFLYSNNFHVELGAVYALIHLRYEPAADLVFERFLEHKNSEKNNNLPLLRRYIVALGELKIYEAIPALTEIAKNFVGCRSKAINALIDLDAKEAIPELIPLLSDPGFRIRDSIIKLILETDYTDASIYIRPLLSDQNLKIRRLAIYALTELKDVPSLETIREIAKFDSNPYVRILALESLIKWLDDDVACDLIYFSGDQNPEIREVVAKRLGEVVALDKNGLDALLRLAEDTHEGTRLAALNALGNHEITNIEDVIEQNQTKKNPIPETIENDIATGISFLEHWQKGLQDIYDTNIANEISEVDQAITTLLRFLNEK